MKTKYKENKLRKKIRKKNYVPKKLDLDGSVLTNVILRTLKIRNIVIWKTLFVE